jgi:hypothetical protein
MANCSNKVNWYWCAEIIGTHFFISKKLNTQLMVISFKLKSKLRYSISVVFCTFCLLVTQLAIAQNTPYFPMLANTQWHIQQTTFGPTTYWWYTTMGDTIIGPHTYKKITSNSANYGDSIIYMREDIANQKVYRRYNNYELLLYDFSLQVGQMIFYDGGQCGIGYYNVLIVDSMLVGSGYRKRIFLVPLNQFSSSIYFIEGIGSFGDPMEPVDCVQDPVVSVVCWLQNGQPLHGGSCSSRPPLPQSCSIQTVTEPQTCPQTNDGSAIVYPVGLAPFTYLWQPGNQTTQQITGLSAGSYTVTVTDSLNCSSTDTVVVSILSQPQLTFSSSPINCYGDSSGTIAVNVTGGIAPYQYSWQQSGDTVSAISGLPAGTYAVTIQDAIGCSITDSVVLDEPLFFDAWITVTSLPTCPTCVDGAAIGQVTGGTPPYTPYWTAPASTGQYQSLAFGEGFQLIFCCTDSNNCLACDSSWIQSTTSVLLTESSEQLTLYPNPADRFIQLKSDDQRLLAMQITIRDLTGRVVLHTQIPVGDSVPQVDVGELPQGCYTITLGSGTELRQTEKLIISR